MSEPTIHLQCNPYGDYYSGSVCGYPGAVSRLTAIVTCYKCIQEALEEAIERQTALLDRRDVLKEQAAQMYVDFNDFLEGAHFGPNDFGEHD